MMNCAEKIEPEFEIDLKTLLYEAMEELSERELRIIFLRYWSELSILDIARHLGMSWDAVDSSLERSLEKLRDALESPGIGLGEAWTKERKPYETH